MENTVHSKGQTVLTQKQQNYRVNSTLQENKSGNKSVALTVMRT